MNLTTARERLRTDVGTSNESARRQWLEATLAAIPAGRSILDAGAGECQYAPACAHLDYTSQDFSQYDGAGQAGLQMGSWDTSRIDIVSDITAIPVPDASFDVVMCTEVLEHVPRPIDALTELARALKPGGLLIVTAPMMSLTHFAPYHFATGFNRYFYEEVLPPLGVDVVETTISGDYFQVVAQELRRLDDVGSRFGQVRLRPWERLARRLLLLRLRDMSAAGPGSSELTGYGLHVLARKRPADAAPTSTSP